MNRNNVAWVLRADGLFNLFAGLVLLTFYRPVVALIGWPNTQMPIYANVLGVALIGLSLIVILVSRHPEQSRGIILSSVLTKALAGATILYWVFVAGIDLPSPWLLPAAVGVQVLFALAEAAYCLPSRTGGPNRRVA
jgi:hypothetical protein